ncbi:MAG: RNA methyltransferase [Treponemataceae bacterium]
MRLSDIVVVLSRPSESGNVGAVCRAMKNMGLTRLRIVTPETESGRLDDEVVNARAVHAVDVYESALWFDSLRLATADCSLIVGTTRRRGKKRKDFSMPPDELSRALRERPGMAAIVFGNERTGLEEEELSLCNMASHIPVDDVFPSLNLSHAVQIFAYELYLAMGRPEEWEDQTRWVPINAEGLDQITTTVADCLESVGFYKQAGRSEQERLFRDIFARAGITLDESRYLEAIFRKMARLATSSVDNSPNREHT